MSYAQIEKQQLAWFMGLLLRQKLEFRTEIRYNSTHVILFTLGTINLRNICFQDRIFTESEIDFKISKIIEILHKIFF